MFNAPNDSFFVDAMVGNIRAAAQGYTNTSNIFVHGVQFWGGAYTNSQGPKNLQVQVMLYSVNSSFQPLTPIDSALVTISNVPDFYEASFTTPHAMNTNFAVGVKNLLNDTMTIITNNAGASWQVPAYNEGLAWRRFGSGVWNSSLNFFGQDLEYMIFPIISYDISSAFSASTNSVCPWTAITFSNISSGPLNNPMFNLHAFNNYWGLAGADSTFRWNYGTVPGWTSSFNGSYSYPLGGNTFTAALSAEMLGYYNTCVDTMRMNMLIHPVWQQTIAASICQGGTYTLGAQTYTNGGVYTQTLASVFGCDSVVTVNLSMNTLDLSVNVSGQVLTANMQNATYQWIDCANSNTAIAGATSRSFTAMSDGSYAVIITDGSCSDTSSCMSILTVGLGSRGGTETEFSIHPNPSPGIITIHSGIRPDLIVVRNTLGQAVMTVKPEAAALTMDLTELPQGVYFVNAQYGIHTRVTRLVKQ